MADEDWAYREINEFESRLLDVLSEIRKLRKEMWALHHLIDDTRAADTLALASSTLYSVALMLSGVYTSLGAAHDYHRTITD